MCVKTYGEIYIGKIRQVLSGSDKMAVSDVDKLLDKIISSIYDDGFEDGVSEGDCEQDREPMYNEGYD